jgi:phospholipid/cholesterol/gamma-HCH transport system substrate-binding protein
MKLMIRFADKIVGALIIIAVGILVFVVFMLGSSQRWFIRDNDYYTYFNSASGLSQNMPVLYKGFTIGRVKSIKFNLDEDRVDVQFSIFKEYTDKVKMGSRVELVSSPISALGGNQFLFHPGRGLEKEPLPLGTVIYPANSPEARNQPDKDLVSAPPQDDTIGNIISQVNQILVKVNGALGGDGVYEENKIKTVVDSIVVSITEIQKLIEKLSSDLDIESLMVQLKPTIGNLRELSDKFKEPDNAVMSFLNSEGDLYGNLEKTLEAASGTLQQLEGTMGDIHSQTPQLAATFDKLLTAMKSVNQVLESVKNNPLLKRGVPEQTETKAGGSSARNMEF